jgi:hypothetical protein
MTANFFTCIAQVYYGDRTMDFLLRRIIVEFLLESCNYDALRTIKEPGIWQEYLSPMIADTTSRVLQIGIRITKQEKDGYTNVYGEQYDQCIHLVQNANSFQIVQ